MAVEEGAVGEIAFRRGTRGLWLVALMLVACAAQAGALYRWTDSEGRMHFGDRPPPANAGDVEQLDMPAFSGPERPADEDPYSILNQLGRLQESRELQERARLERAWADREYYLRQRELDLREQEAAASEPGSISGYVAPRYYPWRPNHRPGRPGHHPGRPGHRPPNRLPGFGGPDHPAYRPRPPYVAPHPPTGHPRPPVPEPRPAPRGATLNLRR